MMGFVEQEIRARRWREYVEALEVERKKIQVFQRELPLCLQLVNQTIESFRQQQQQLVCDEETCSDVPVLEEFIPIKRSSTVEEQQEEEEESSPENQSKDVTKACGQEEEEEKPDWFQTVQLSIKPPNTSNDESKPKMPISLESKKARGAFHPFNRDQKRSPTVEVPPPPPETAAASSTADTGSGGGDRRSGDEKDQGQSNRKARRCWSPELHRRFLHALQQLGGSHVATPKQIRELMKVDGLTNDEVKSHLQKYRLHTKRPSSTGQENGGGGAQTPQVILVGGIWVPPPEYTAVAKAEQTKTNGSAAPTNRIYAPVPLLPGTKCKDTNNSSSNGEGGPSSSSSPTTSSSSLTITTSLRLRESELR